MIAIGGALNRGLIVLVAGLCLIGAALAVKKEPSLLVAQLGQELANLEQDFKQTVVERYPEMQAAAERLIARRPGKDGLALKQMANLFAKIEQTKFAARKFGLKVATRILQEQFLQQDGASQVKADLRLQKDHAELLVERARLRSLIDAYQYGDNQWRELYTLIAKFVAADQRSLYPELHQLASLAHAQRFALQQLATDAFSDQEDLLEGKSEEEAALLLAHVDNVIDGATQCQECRDLESQKGESNFFTYPMSTERDIQAMIEPLAGLEASYRETKAALGSLAAVPAGEVDEEDIGFQGQEFLGLSFD